MSLGPLSISIRCTALFYHPDGEGQRRSRDPAPATHTAPLDGPASASTPSAPLSSRDLLRQDSRPNDTNHGAAAKAATISRDPIRRSRARYARHGRELVGCKSPVRKRELIGGQYTKCKPNNRSTRRRQLRGGDEPWGGSLRTLDRCSNRQRSRQNCEATNRNAIEAQRDPAVSCPWIAKPFPTDSRVDGELVQRKFTFLFGEICDAYP